MSAIAGIIHFDGAPVSSEALAGMTASMAHRGPDGIRHWIKGSVGLGQCMFRTTPESLEETQPLANEDESLVLVMDGRVDNYAELRRELLGRGAILRDHSDAELVLRAYEVWGEQCAQHIIGEFAFFIWDARQRRLFGARDAIGTRHFYYHIASDWFGFASEIKGLLATKRIQTRLNESRLLDYLVTEFDRDDVVNTFYQGVVRLPAGHAMTCSNGRVTTWRYWQPADLPPAKLSLAECAEGMREQLRVAVQCRLRSTGPMGAMLSGGLDSSSIVCLIDKEFRDLLSQPLRTFSLIQQDREQCPDWHSISEIIHGNDWLDARLISSGAAGEAAERYLQMIPSLDEPFALSHGMPYILLFEQAGQSGCKVVLDGYAGDLLFYHAERSLDYALRQRQFRLIPGILQAYRYHNIQRPYLTLLQRALAAAAPQTLRDAMKWLRRRRQLYRGELGVLQRRVALDFLQARQSAGNPVAPADEQARHAANFTGGLISFAHEVYGQMAFANGLEPRSPFSDRRLVEFSIQMPHEAKLFAPAYKHTLREAMQGILPESVRQRSVIGGHPGWMFYNQFISAVAPKLFREQEIRQTLARLGPWLDGNILFRYKNCYTKNTNDDAGLRLINTAVLSRWMAAKGLQPACEP